VHSSFWSKRFCILSWKPVTYSSSTLAHNKYWAILSVWPMSQFSQENRLYHTENVIERTFLSLLAQTLFFPEKNGNIDVFWRPQQKGKIIFYSTVPISQNIFSVNVCRRVSDYSIRFFPIPSKFCCSLKSYCKIYSSFLAAWILEFVHFIFFSST